MAIAIAHGPRASVAPIDARSGRRHLRFLVTSRPEGVARHAVSDLAAELAFRPRLSHPTVRWDDALDGIVIELDRMAPSPQHARGAAADDLFDAVAAALGEVDWFQVRSLDTTPNP